MTYTTPGERKWKRMGLLIKLFLRHADTGFVVTVHQMYVDRRQQDMALAVYGNQAQPTPASNGAIPIRSSSGRRAASNVADWSTEFGYGLPISRKTPNGVALTDPYLQDSGVRDWLCQVDECEHPSSALKILGTGSTRTSLITYNSGLSMVCKICGGRWQRLHLCRQDSNLSVRDGASLKPFEIGIPLLLPCRSPWGKEAVEHRLRLEVMVAVARV